jgi:serine/threonine protein kinase
MNANEFEDQSDIWSLGLTLVEIVLGRYPVPVPTDDDVHRCMAKDTEFIRSERQRLSLLQNRRKFYTVNARI